MIRKSPFVHLFLFAIFPVLSFYLSHWKEATISDAFLLGGLSIVGVLVLWLVIFIFIRDAKKAALIISLAVLLFFSFGYIRAVLTNLYNGPFGLARYRYLFSIWAIIFIAGTYSLMRSSRVKDHLTSGANRAGLIMIAAAVFSFGISNRSIFSSPVSGVQRTFSSTASSVTVVSDTKPPDIYYIIPDGYARADTLKEVYGFDNSEFVKALGQRGFYVPTRSRSNYAQTFLSLTSSLNMEYHVFSEEEEATTEGRDQLIRKNIQFRLENNRVIDFLRSQGYTIINFDAAGWYATARNRNAHINVSCGLYSEFITAFTQTTILEPWPNVFSPFGGKKLLCALDKLAQAPEMGASPRFVFAHLSSPHPPNWFGPGGELLPTKDTLEDWTFKQGYRDGVSHINARLIKLVEQLLQKSETPPVIVIHGDHGSASFGGATSDSPDWNLSNIDLIKERMPIFSALYLPGVKDYEKESVLYPDLTSVNIFRIIFNRYFGAKYERLPDKSYFATYEYPYKLLDVTSYFEK